jgi:hypothetical protein
MLNWETIQVNASTINDFLVILGTPWWIDGLVNGGFACWLVCRLVELLCGGFANGWAHREVKPVFAIWKGGDVGDTVVLQ